MPDRFLLDSNICIYLLKDLSPRLTRKVQDQDEGTLLVSTITLAEIGFGAQRDEKEAEALARFLRDVDVVAFDLPAATAYADVPFRRHRFDRLIGAHAVAAGATLVTNNEADFADIPNLAVENWTL